MEFARCFDVATRGKNPGAMPLWAMGSRRLKTVARVAGLAEQVIHQHETGFKLNPQIILHLSVPLLLFL